MSQTEPVHRPRCDGCLNDAATRKIRIESYPGSGRAVERNCCDSCYSNLGQPETLCYICRGCGGEAHYPDLCQACQADGGLRTVVTFRMN